MTWGRTLKKALRGKDLPTAFVEWRELAADRDGWRLICGGVSRPAPTSTKADMPSGRILGTAPLKYSNDEINQI